MARTQGLWKQVSESYLQPIEPGGINILISGVNRYLNFNSVSGSGGYGFRDSAGTMEVKDSGGAWSAIATAADLLNYFYLPGRSGGQTGYGGTDASDNLTLESTSHATKGNINLGDSLKIAPDGSAPGNTSFGVTKWSRSYLYEQGGSGDPNRFFYLSRGDRWELLNELGSQFILSVRGSGAAQPNTMYMVGSIAIGSVYFAQNTPSNGAIIAGNVGIGTGFGNSLTPSVQLHVRETSANETVRVEGGNDFGSIQFRTNYAGTNLFRGLLGYEDNNGGGWANGSFANSMVLRGETNGVGVSDATTLIATFRDDDGVRVDDHFVSVQKTNLLKSIAVAR